MILLQRTTLSRWPVTVTMTITMTVTLTLSSSESESVTAHLFLEIGMFGRLRIAFVARIKPQSWLCEDTAGIV
jgi:hypothetical protein